ncbi:hypothetical protein GCM10027445_10040 [Amycolatopsis endophytica]|uniref:Uncharacterized protein n=1 Tax=Amycolatopsis endophytica TaxID=860233 RepID=A0A853AX22_9PSEU|nr:hypothetical protein [Amycolatopsis endophytica]NYI87240.1 hypothetical protein [Amycolatopsis endophytica]
MSSDVRRQRRELTLGITIVVVLMLGLAVSATGFLVTRNAGLADPPDAKPAPEHSALALVEPPGAPGPSGPFTLASLRTTVSLPQPMVDVLTTAGMSDGMRKTGVQSEVTVGLYAMTTGDPEGAVKAFGEGEELQGLTTDRDLSLEGVEVYGTPVGVPLARFGTAYVLYDRVVVVETTGVGDATRDVFRTTLRRQLDLAPPSES